MFSLQHECIDISHISSEWDLHFSAFEIATLALPWVSGTFVTWGS